ncbi:MAG: 3-keto-disaccharide hydrolase [Leadbetterella sp.]
MIKKIALLSLLGLSFTVALFGQKKKWVNIFDGKTTANWHSWGKTEVVGWQVVDGILTTSGKNGDLVSDKEYGDFILEFEFKVQPKGNSGIIYKCIEKPSDPAYSWSYFSGPEYQIIDDTNYPHKIVANQKTGANYDLDDPLDLTLVKPAGEWNKGKIKIKDNTVTHFLNGKKIVEYTYGDAVWVNKVTASKFSKMPYATPHHMGRIVLQDHKDEISFKYIRIKEL